MFSGSTGLRDVVQRVPTVKITTILRTFVDDCQNRNDKNNDRRRKSTSARVIIRRTKKCCFGYVMSCRTDPQTWVLRWVSRTNMGEKHVCRVILSPPIRNDTFIFGVVDERNRHRGTIRPVGLVMIYCYFEFSWFAINITAPFCTTR